MANVIFRTVMVSDRRSISVPPGFSVCPRVISPRGQTGTPAKPQEHPRSPYDPLPHRAGFPVHGNTQQPPMQGPTRQWGGFWPHICWASSSVGKHRNSLASWPLLPLHFWGEADTHGAGQDPLSQISVAGSRHTPLMGAEPHQLLANQIFLLFQLSWKSEAH